MGRVPLYDKKMIYSKLRIVLRSDVTPSDMSRHEMSPMLAPYGVVLADRKHIDKIIVGTLSPTLGSLQEAVPASTVYSASWNDLCTIYEATKESSAISSVGTLRSKVVDALSSLDPTPQLAMVIQPRSASEGGAVRLLGLLFAWSHSYACRRLDPSCTQH